MRVFRFTQKEMADRSASQKGDCDLSDGAACSAAETRPVSLRMADQSAALVAAWCRWADTEQLSAEQLAALDQILATRTCLVGHAKTKADDTVAAAVARSAMLARSSYLHLSRWLRFIAPKPRLQLPSHLAVHLTDEPEQCQQHMDAWPGGLAEQQSGVARIPCGVAGLLIAMLDRRSRSKVSKLQAAEEAERCAGSLRAAGADCGGQWRRHVRRGSVWCGRCGGWVSNAEGWVG